MVESLCRSIKPLIIIIVVLTLFFCSRLFSLILLSLLLTNDLSLLFLDIQTQINLSVH